MFVRIHTAFKKITVSQWVLVGLFIMAFGTSIGSWLITPPDGRNADWWTSWLQNFSTEMFGAITTFILFELIVGRSEKEQARLQEIQQRKAEILRRLQSGDSTVTKVAFEEARAEGWLRDGTLANADLAGANLEGMNLEGANLARVDLAGANLRHA
ncbi:MAG: pentapeptide repeat-containing protein, partial [Phototrophicaceae bacterium]